MEPHLLKQASFFEIHSPLLAFRRDVTSQNGEDGIIEEIFSIIGSGEKFCVELGAWDGKHLSNCFNLVENHRWSCLFIEANAGKFSSLKKNHGENERVACLNAFVGFKGAETLDSLMKGAGVPSNFDLLSIDLDGIDYFVWESVVEFSPRVVVVEFNPSVPNDVIFVQPKDVRINQGASLLALILLARMKGYELVCCTKCNALFVKSDLFGCFDIPSNSIWSLYSPVCDGRIFHGYDSTVYVCGMEKLIWSGVKVSSGDFQVLPRALREYRDAQA
ncbi:hypothetical protein [Thioalkalivibrio sp. AKL10]|uniref:hypothetical protein n=1 Tax=Thioalkalivibrio sp. AKL10 TaxID=1158158 RepID=UPI0012DD0E9C|nr:hypothetical protein [Thioalkalivibrio sp. AKL10]